MISSFQLEQGCALPRVRRAILRGHFRVLGPLHDKHSRLAVLERLQGVQSCCVGQERVSNSPAQPIHPALFFGLGQMLSSKERTKNCLGIRHGS